jgi:FkbM family methyltransferase
MAKHIFGAQWNYLKSQPGFKKRPLVVLFRLVAWRILCRVGKSTDIELSHHGGIKLSLPPLWRGVSKLVYTFREDYEPELSLLDRFIPSGGGMVDVGANFGIYSLVASRLVGDSGHVHAFEPAQAAFESLEHNIALNGMNNVQAHRLALGERSGEARLFHNADPSRNTLAGSDGELDFENVQIRRLDDVLAESAMSKVDFIKIDTEGAEELVARGAENTIRRDKPVILFEINAPRSSWIWLVCGWGLCLSSRPWVSVIHL